MQFWRVYSFAYGVLSNAVLEDIFAYGVFSMQFWRAYSSTVVVCILAMRNTRGKNPGLGHSPQPLQSWSFHVFKTNTMWEDINHVQLQLPAWDEALDPVEQTSPCANPEETLSYVQISPQWCWHFINHRCFLNPGRSASYNVLIQHKKFH